MAALHGLRLMRDELAAPGVEHAGGAGVEGGINGKDEHDGAYHSRAKGG
jgi:hypothetical protein